MPTAAGAKLAVACSLSVILTIGDAVAAPDLADRHRFGGLDLVGDSERPFIAYVLPPPFVLAAGRDKGEGPGGELFLTRYTGSAPHGDSGEHFVRSLLRFRVEAGAFDPATLVTARREMAAHRGQPDLRLLPLPIVRTEATVVARGIEDELEAVLKDGFFEATAQNRSTVFSEREFILPLSPLTAQAFAAAIEAGGLVVSLSYALWTDALPPARGGEIETTGAVGGELPLGLNGDPADESEPVRLVALADTLPVPVTRLTKVDLDLGAPPDYPSLRVYCFDFADALRDDLFLKEVEFDAAGVAGGRTGYRVSFSQDDPAGTVRSVRFPFAADLGEPYRFRVLEVLHDGEVREGEWQDRENWAAIIDITSAAAGPLVEPTDDSPRGHAREEPDRPQAHSTVVPPARESEAIP